MKASFLVVILLVAGCAAFEDPVVKQARELVAAGRGEQALALLQKDPQHVGEYHRTRELLAAQWFAQAEVMRVNGQPEAAAELLRRIQKYDPANPRARAGLEQLEMDARHRPVIAGAERLVREESYFEAQDLLRPVLLENPQNREARRLQRVIEERTVKPAIVTPRLKTSTSQPISLEMRDVALRAVFDTISRATGVSFVFDKDVRVDQRTTIVLRNAAPEELIRLVLATNQLEQKIVNETTVLVFPNTPQKLREYQELVVKSFYIANADVRQTANMIRTLVKTRDIFIDEKVNLLVIKDTPSAVRLAERLIAAQDLAEPEVMLQVEVLEMSRNRLLELGIKYPDSVAWSLVGAAGIPGVVSLPEWLNRGSELVQLRFTDPLFLASFLQ
ncbi:MAG TPA: secretin and TonB N-terminal domain-containing protein, partial [Burkholderiales bacterium]|nr:secretin and TonB N-terminal domain-containing protein [Burkholderiales bacterium]